MNTLATFGVEVGVFGLLICAVTLLADGYAAWQRHRRVLRVLRQFDYYRVDD